MCFTKSSIFRSVRNFPLPPRIKRSLEFIHNRALAVDLCLSHFAVSAHLNSRTFNSYFDRFVGRSQCSWLFSLFGLTHSPMLCLCITVSFLVTQEEGSRRPAGPLRFHNLFFLSPVFRSCPCRSSYPRHILQCAPQSCSGLSCSFTRPCSSTHRCDPGNVNTRSAVTTPSHTSTHALSNNLRHMFPHSFLALCRLHATSQPEFLCPPHFRVPTFEVVSTRSTPRPTFQCSTILLHFNVQKSFFALVLACICPRLVCFLHSFLQSL